MFPSQSNDDTIIVSRPKKRSSIFDELVRVQRHSFDLVLFSNVVKDAVRVAWYVFNTLRALNLFDIDAPLSSSLLGLFSLMVKNCRQDRLLSGWVTVASIGLVSVE
jgi:hypothetical protein